MDTIIITYDKIEKNRYVRTITYNTNEFIVDTPLNFEILNNITKEGLKKDFDNCIVILRNKPLKIFRSN